MIEKGRVTLRRFRASWATVVGGLHPCNLLCAMFPNKMNDPICLRKCLMRAEGTFEIGGLV